MAAKPEFRRPWENGARAYFEADTFAAAREGFKRMRKDKDFLMLAGSQADTSPCAYCGIALGEIGKDAQRKDKYSFWTYSAKRKQVGNGLHYLCGWQSLMIAVFKAADEGRI